MFKILGKKTSSILKSKRLKTSPLWALQPLTQSHRAPDQTNSTRTWHLPTWLDPPLGPPEPVNPPTIWHQFFMRQPKASIIYTQTLCPVPEDFPLPAAVPNLHSYDKGKNSQVDMSQTGP